VVAQLEVLLAVDHLPGEPAVTDEVTLGVVQDPEPDPSRA